MRIRAVLDGDHDALIALWESCGVTRPWNDPRDDIALAIATPNSDILIGEEDGSIIGSAMVGFDGHRGWVYYLAVAPLHRGSGHGRALMDAAEAWLRNCGVPKIQLMVRQENEEAARFYRKLGLEQQPMLVFGKRLDRY